MKEQLFESKKESNRRWEGRRQLGVNTTNLIIYMCENFIVKLILFKVDFIFNDVYICVYLCVDVVTFRVQKRESAPLELEF